MPHLEATVCRLLLFTGLAATPASLSAEEPPADPGTSAAGLLTVERLPSGFVIAPDARFADVDGHFGNFIGGYVGWMTDRTFLIGAGGYWLTNDPNGIDMAYGGLVVEWTVRANQRFTLSARALVGGGGASLTDTLANLGYRYPPDGRGFDPRHYEPYGRGHGYPPGQPLPPATRVRYHDDFFVAEPQVNAAVRFNSWLRLGAGVGYRLTAGAHQDDRLRGVSGTLSFQIGGS